MIALKITAEIDFDRTIGRNRIHLSVDWRCRLDLRRFRANPLGNHPFGCFKHAYFTALLAQHFPAELDDAAAFAAAEVLVDIG